MKLWSSPNHRDKSRHHTSPFGPDGVVVGPRQLQIDDTLCSTFAVAGYPRDVQPGWLDPLLSSPHSIDVSVQIEPIDRSLAAQRLRGQLARLESTRRVDSSHGRLQDPDVEAAAEDASALARQVARGDSRLFRVAITVAVRARVEDELRPAVENVRGILAALLADLRPMTFRELDGWVSTLPLGINKTGITRTFDTPALAATFPFPPAELSQPDGVFYGTNSSGPGLVFWDRFAQQNHNSVILARSGSGKSYLAKLEILRSLYRGIDVLVVDPEDEYRRLCEEVDGTYIQLGAPEIKLNPFDLGPGPDAVTRQALFIHSLIEVLLRERLTSGERASLDKAVVAAYEEVGITSDKRSYRRTPPTMGTLLRILRNQRDANLAERLAPFVTGSFRGLFDGPTTVRPDAHLVVFSLRDLPDELKPAATMVALDRIWQQVSDPTNRKRRLVTVDEAWLLMRDPHGAKFLFQLAKSARKHWCGLTVITQDAGDLLGSELGKAIVANAATQILMRQAPQAIDVLAEAFKISEGERSILLSAAPGESVLCVGQNRVAFRAVASPQEHLMVTTSPEELIQEDLS